MLADARIRALLADHTDADSVEIYRKCVYGFSAVVAERFSQGRVYLAGDAAHMTPPFAGQGLNAGLRDVRNLSWKLARVLDGTLPASLLDTYDVERHDAARTMVDMAVMLGDQIQPTDTGAATERDAMFAEINSDPAAAAAFGRDVVAPLSDVRLPAGWFAGDGLGGRMLPQPTVGSNDGEVLLDDVIGPGFTALVVAGADVPEEILAHPLWAALAPSVHQPGVEVLGDFAGGKLPRIILVRPDRFVLAALDTSDDPTAVMDGLLAALGQRQ
jgi:3-(3-hydroxy-phenyl)propionate hydroxylase